MEEDMTVEEPVVEHAMAGDRPGVDDDQPSWACGVTLKRTANSGATWSIAVPADGRDHRADLRHALGQALEVWEELEQAFPVRATARKRAG